MVPTLEEIKTGLQSLSEAERRDLQHLLDVLEVVNDPDHPRRSNEAMRRMDAGDKVSLEGFIRANASPEVLKLLGE